MNRYLISVAALALMAAPALAQHDEHGGHPGGGHEHGGPPPAATPAAPAAAPAAAPQPMRSGNAAANTHGGFQGGGMRPGAPAAAPTAPTTQPQAMRDGDHGNRGDFRGDRGDFRGNRGDFRGNNTQPSGNADVNRAMHDNRGPDNRFGPGNRPDYNGPGNRPDYNRPGNRPDFGNGFNRPGRPANAPRPNFNGFRDYHRNFSAPQRFHAPSYRRPYGWYYRRWTFGEFLPALFWAQQYWLTDYDEYDLPPPPPGTVWVRYGSDALLIDRWTGEIITVEYGVFY